jgi:RNA polymerase sigma factor (sigma-70 family)
MIPRIVVILARKFAHSHEDEEDLIQEGMLAYYRAQQTYKPDQNAKFETYASRVITNRFIDLARKRHTDTSFDEEHALADTNFDDAVDISEIKRVLSQNVPDLERAIFNSYIEGFSYEEIGKIFDLTPKKIDNTVQKVKKIIKERVGK